MPWGHGWLAFAPLIAIGLENKRGGSMKLGLIAALFLLFSGAAFAGCSASAYDKACKECGFYADGKMDKGCYDAKQSDARACLAAAYPIASAKYAAGRCPEIDACINRLESCKSAASSGNDKTDCAFTETAVHGCFESADTCVKNKADKCGQEIPFCGAPAAIALLGSVFVYGSGRKKR